MAALPFSLHVYRAATGTLECLVPFALRRRVRRGKERRERLTERLGTPSLPRPDGQLIWVHGASVGECLSVLPLIDALLEVPGRSILLTSGTIASAEIMAERLPRRAFHQFVPIDTPTAVTRFLDHWHPDAALFVDSEIWPNMLVGAQAKGVCLAIVNGRLSAKSFAGWRYAKKMASVLLSLYDVCLVQDEETAQRLTALGAPNVEVTGNLKADGRILPADPRKLADLQADLRGRPVFLAASTHTGEDETILGVHDRLREDFPALVTIIVPRHSERGGAIARLCGSRTVARRSQGHELGATTAVYIADTMGELGLFYRVATFAFLGGSLVRHGGQNPLEAARLGVAVLCGPYTDNFREAYDALFAAQGIGRVVSPSEIVILARRLLADPPGTVVLGKAAARAAESLGGALSRTRLAVETMLSSHARA